MTDHQSGMPSVRELRERDLMEALIAILDEHTRRGFSYPKPSEGFRLPLGVHFAHESTELFGSMVVFDGHRIVINLWLIYEQAPGIDEALDALATDPRLARAQDTLSGMMNDIRHTYYVPKKPELHGMLSQALGSYLIAHHLRKHPQSWLNPEGIASAIIRGGMQAYFASLYHKTGERVSDCVWNRFADDPDAQASFWAGEGFRAKAGYWQVAPILRDFGQQGLEWLMDNGPPDPTRIPDLPAYARDAHLTLSEGGYPQA